MKSVAPRETLLSFIFSLFFLFLASFPLLFLRLFFPALVHLIARERFVVELGRDARVDERVDQGSVGPGHEDQATLDPSDVALGQGLRGLHAEAEHHELREPLPHAIVVPLALGHRSRSRIILHFFLTFFTSSHDPLECR